MKLRNKETGGLASILDDEQDFIRVYTDAGWHDYDTLAELTEEWEDYKPSEPLIKDEKVRKAVRAWAEAVGIECCMYDKRLNAFASGSIFINFPYRLRSAMPQKEKIYRIAELCGEEE